MVLQSTFQTATKAASRKHRSNGCTPSNHGQLQYSSNYQWRERGMQKNTSVEHTLRFPPPFPFCCEWARKKGSGENRCGEYAKGQEPTFHSHISFWVYLAHLYFGSLKKNSTWLLIIKNNPRRMSCYALPSCIDAFHYFLKGHILKTLLAVKLKKIKWFEIFFKAVTKTETNVIFNLWLTVNWQDMNMNFTKWCIITASAHQNHMPTAQCYSSFGCYMWNMSSR